MAWLDAMGVLAETAEPGLGRRASRDEPSLQLIGDEGHRSLDLGILQAEGVRVVGRVLDVRGRQVALADDLAASVEHAEAKMHRLLDRVDRFIDVQRARRELRRGRPPAPRARAAAAGRARPRRRRASEPSCGPPATVASIHGSTSRSWTTGASSGTRAASPRSRDCTPSVSTSCAAETRASWTASAPTPPSSPITSSAGCGAAATWPPDREEEPRHEGSCSDRDAVRRRHRRGARRRAPAPPCSWRARACRSSPSTGPTRGSDTTSTHALMRPGLMQLHRWGVLERIVAADTPPIRRTTFHYGRDAVEVAIQPRDGVDALYSPRRTVLDRLLADAAAEAGAQVLHDVVAGELVRASLGSRERRAHHGRRRRGATRRGGHRHRRRRRALRDRPRRERGDPPVGPPPGRSALRALARAAPRRHALVLREGSRRGRDPHQRRPGMRVRGHAPRALHDRERARPRGLFGQVLAATDATLARQVAAAEREGKLHPFPGRAGFVRQAWGPGWALVGDAECFKDPITAHGMSDALRDAELLAQAVVGGHGRGILTPTRRRAMSSPASSSICPTRSPPSTGTSSGSRCSTIA